MKRTDEQILSGYVDGQRLKCVPAKRSKKLIVLRWLVQRFEPGVRYTEREVNDLIAQSHPDFATLRRELFDAYLIERADGVYWREP
ncbi:MAG TPA: DUF2087 domain-containing protein [Candidatus Baltobacteraceae bacterium]|nr:DUF2087 domain-containing protein [Candidatus Baltobacteraceae bacterium]